MRGQVEEQSVELAERARVDNRVRALEQHIERLSSWQSQRGDESLELARLQRAEAENDKWHARVESDLRAMRESAEYDRLSLQKATRALNAATASVEERQAQSDASLRAARETLSSLSARQQVLHEEIGHLADAMHEATLGGGSILLPRGATRASSVNPTCTSYPTYTAAAALDTRDAQPMEPPGRPLSAPPTASLAAAFAASAGGHWGAPSAYARDDDNDGGTARRRYAREAEAEHAGGRIQRDEEATSSTARREAAAHRLAEAQRRLDYEDALASARSAGRQRVSLA